MSCTVWKEFDISKRLDFAKSFWEKKMCVMMRFRIRSHFKHHLLHSNLIVINLIQNVFCLYTYYTDTLEKSHRCETLFVFLVWEEF